MYRLKATMTLVVACLIFQAKAYADPRFVVRPYLMDVSQHGIAVLFTLAHEGAVSVLVEAEAHEPKRVESPTAVRHEVVIDGLDPDTRYVYRLLQDGDELARGSFATAPSDPNAPIRFLLYGDTRTNPAAHAAVIRAMGDDAADFVVHTGDFIADGRSFDSWTNYFDDAAPLLASTPLVPAIGNHDMYAGEGLRNYRAYMRVSNGSPNETYFIFRYGPLLIVSLDTEESLQRASPQRLWLEQVLRDARQDATIKHIFLAMHHGLYSSGSHGSNELVLGTEIERLFRRSGVTLIMSGHDHIYERGDDRGLKYIVSGGGGAPLYFANREIDAQLAFAPVHHFVRVEIEGGEVRIAAIGSDGRTFDACSFNGRSDPWHCEGGGSRGIIARTETNSMSRYVIVLGAVLVGVVAILARRRRSPARKKAS